ETDVATTAISYDGAVGRMGDMISAYGKASDNSLVIYAGVANSDKFVKFTTSDNGQTFTPTVVTLPSGKLGTVPNIAQTKDGHLYIKSYGNPLFRFDPATNAMDTVSTSIVGTSATKIKYFATAEGEFLVIYYPDVPGAGDAEKIHVLDITQGPKRAFVKYFSSSIGKFANGNGTGSVDVMKVSDDTQLFFILGTNNGVAAFSNNSQFVVSELDTLFYGNTPVLHRNPSGSGFIVGTNSYGDIGKYQWFDLKARDVLHGFKFYFAYKNIVNDPDTISLVVKTVQPNGAPGENLAEVKTTTDVLDTTKMGNVFFLENPLTLTGLIFIGFEWSTTADDEFALFADANGEGDKANRVWEKFNDGQYNDFTNPTYSWGLDTDLWIEAYYKKAAPTAADPQAGVGLPKDYVLKQNYPNPFNPSTTIELAIPENADVEIAIYNILGQKVADVFKGKLNAGYHKFDFTANNLSSGVYLYKVKANHFESVKKMTILK
ncbi:MAG: T9SS type A sorting domain-containing protein, partial [candidate division KSB1 bacterium]|nr:T9SS type A sorting domain-containing protein [candidate division KSB1 bacterium]